MQVTSQSQNPIELRFSLHLLRCASVFHSHVEQRFRKEFETTTPRFEVLTELSREPMGVTLSPGGKVQPNRSTLRSPAGLRAACSSIFNERAPTPPRFIGHSTWMSGSDRGQTFSGSASSSIR